MKYRVQVNTFGDHDGVFTGNAMVYETADEAEAAVRDLFQRWTAVKFWRVIDENDAVIVEGP